MFFSFQIFMIYLEILYVLQMGQKYMPYLKEYLTIYQALLYTKQNLPVLTITTLNGFKIGSSTTEIRRVSKVSLTMNNPVGNVFRSDTADFCLGISHMKYKNQFPI